MGLGRGVRTSAAVEVRLCVVAMALLGPSCAKERERGEREERRSPHRSSTLDPGRQSPRSKL